MQANSPQQSPLPSDLWSATAVSNQAAEPALVKRVLECSRLVCGEELLATITSWFRFPAALGDSNHSLTHLLKVQSERQGGSADACGNSPTPRLLALPLTLSLAILRYSYGGNYFDDGSGASFRNYVQQSSVGCRRFAVSRSASFLGNYFAVQLRRKLFRRRLSSFFPRRVSAPFLGGRSTVNHADTKRHSAAISEPGRRVSESWLFCKGATNRLDLDFALKVSGEFEVFIHLSGHARTTAL
eukprot:TRINITY_DN49111_c0_g1_i1.p1 TRINITY_DN49111_c0_g1~~TRINITY_DN49111_c0_g1_i1.p1  ORF type:complete len:242 (+),score=20.76 TRINITY_DN49111_c0_g1_i1:169-894(+)